MENEIILQVDNLAKVYSGLMAVDNVSFAVRSGEVIGLLGPNGAGKTTIINMVLGVLEPTAGKVEIFGQDIRSERIKISQKMNFAAVYAQLPPNMTIWQNLYVFGLLYSVPDLRLRIGELLEEFDLAKFAHTKAGLLSSGELSRLNLAKAVINRPQLLLLDEPTASLDPSVAETVRSMIKNYAERTGAAILWTSHNMREIEAVCDQVMFLSRGRIVLAGDPRRLPSEHGKRDLDELFIAVAREPLTLKE